LNRDCLDQHGAQTRARQFPLPPKVQADGSLDGNQPSLRFLLKRALVFRDDDPKPDQRHGRKTEHRDVPRPNTLD